jgi:spermidine/putrescine-binding protein
MTMKKTHNNGFSCCAVCCSRFSAASAESLTVVSWGGAYTKSQVEAYHKPWTSQDWHKCGLRRLQWRYRRNQSSG